MRIDLETLLQRLDVIGAGYEVLQLSPGWDVVVSAFGGRIHGPYYQGQDPAGWVAPEFETEAAAQNLADTRNWNIGAQRLWLSPELRIFVGDRTRFWETFVVPDALDPGRHALRREGESIILTQSGELADSGRFEVTRRITPVRGAVVPEGLSHVAAAQYRHVIEVRSESPSLPVLPWIVAQVEPGGEAIIPADPGTDAVTMLGTPPGSVLRARDDAVRMPVDCTSLHKIGLPASRSFGQLGYRFPRENRSALNLYRCSHDRSGHYPDEPAGAPGVDGCATFVFQDEGSLGRYGELEFVGQEIGLSADGWRMSALQIDVLFCIGSDAEMSNVEKCWMAGSLLDPLR